MSPRQRRAARRRALRKRFPIGCRIWADTDGQIEGKYIMRTVFGEWFVYGYKGQSLLVRRAGMMAGYRATLKELAQ